eukprot:12739861-Alexandrium_andersonii.AAC.1
MPTIGALRHARCQMSIFRSASCRWPILRVLHRPTRAPPPAERSAVQSFSGVRLVLYAVAWRCACVCVIARALARAH